MASNYPPGFIGAVRGIVLDLYCPECGYEWMAGATEELGGVFLADDDDAYCPECGAEGEEK